MNYTENYKGVKIDVQSPNADISTAVQEEIRLAIDKLSRFTTNINAADFYFKVEGSNNAALSSVSIRLGIPGPDVFADDTGDNWISLVKSVTDKLIRQLEKK
jgi:ribosomal subunit interface protein